MRSVPPTGLPSSTLKPGQTRHLPTPLVSLKNPSGATAGPIVLPGKGERLRLARVDELKTSPKVATALRALTAAKVPLVVDQLVIWRLAGAMDWSKIAELARGWATAEDLALARHFVDRIEGDGLPRLGLDAGRIDVEVAESGRDQSLAEVLRERFARSTVLGLRTIPQIPAHPEGPSLALRVAIEDTGAGKHKVSVDLEASNDQAYSWKHLGSYEIEAGDLADVDRLADQVVAKAIARLVRVELAKGPKVKGKPSYTVRIENQTPLILDGLDLSGTHEKAAHTLGALGIRPGQTLSVPASADVVKKCGWLDGIAINALDLNGL